MSLRRIVIGLAALVVLVLGIAWIDGGEEPLREISQTVPMPSGVPAGALEQTR